MKFAAVSFAVTLASVSASYYKVTGETCRALQSTTNLFSNLLLPCATYSESKVDLVCLAGGEIESAVKTVPLWTHVPDAKLGDSLNRSFTFDDFQHAFLFMTMTAQLAEKNQHHPDWHNVYNQLDVKLTTDDKACLSAFDIELATGMDALYAMLTTPKAVKNLRD